MRVSVTAPAPEIMHTVTVILATRFPERGMAGFELHCHVKLTDYLEKSRGVMGTNVKFVSNTLGKVYRSLSLYEFNELFPRGLDLSFRVED